MILEKICSFAVKNGLYDYWCSSLDLRHGHLLDKKKTIGGHNFYTHPTGIGLKAAVHLFALRIILQSSVLIDTHIIHPNQIRLHWKCFCLLKAVRTLFCIKKSFCKADLFVWLHDLQGIGNKHHLPGVAS